MTTFQRSLMKATLDGMVRQRQQMKAKGLCTRALDARIALQEAQMAR